LPAFLTDQSFKQAAHPFVKGLVFLREGNMIEIFQPDGSITADSSNRNYTDNIYLYQKFLERPEIDIRLKEGLVKKKWLIGSFIACGK
jgi:glutathionylspermidine synthase